MIKEEYISFEVAKLLKNKGFDAKCRYYYIQTKEMFEIDTRYHTALTTQELLDLQIIGEKEDRYAAPTQAIAMRWLREVHSLCLFVIPATIDKTFRTGYALYPQCDSKWEWCASKNDRSKATFGVDINKKYCDSYEQACEAAIKYCLENLI